MVSPPMIVREVLTGRVRGRPRRLLPGLTLQVEVRIESAHGFEAIPYPPPPGSSAAEWAAREKVRIEAAWTKVGLKWRDATRADRLDGGRATA